MPPGWFAENAAPRIEIREPGKDAPGTEPSKLAACDLLFLPREADEARLRAGELGKRTAFRESLEPIGPFPQPDLSARSMAAWARALLFHASHPESERMIFPERPAKNQGRAPAEIEDALARFAAEHDDGAGSCRLLPAFRSLAAAFGASIETAALRSRADIAELLALHERIVARAELRLRHERLDEADDAALAGLDGA
jgi:hypothetical protein